MQNDTKRRKKKAPIICAVVVPNNEALAEAGVSVDDEKAVHDYIWDEIKKIEKSQESVTDTLRGISSALPALVRAAKTSHALIILAIHEGFDQNSATLTAMPVSDAQLRSYYDVTLSDGYVDLVFEADSHFMYAMEVRSLSTHTQPFREQHR